MSENSSPRFHLDSPVQYLKGVGPRRAQLLARLGIERGEDLLYHLPHDYLERSSLVSLREIREGQAATVRGQIIDLQSRRIRGGRTLVSGVLMENGLQLHLSWFNAAWVAKQLRIGEELVVSGRVSAYRRRLQMINPSFEDASGEGELLSGGMVPCYPLTAGISQTTMRKLVRTALDALRDETVDPLPPSWREEESLLDLKSALEGVHRPQEAQQAAAGRRRLAFDEALALQLSVGVRRRQLLRRNAAVRIHDLGELSGEYLNSLGFTLTGAQRRVLKTLKQDLAREIAMHRLLQGDVGSGKTLVAVLAMIWMAENGAQAAFMAPTEILARQHATRNLPRLQKIGIHGAVLTGSTPAARRREILRELKTGRIQLVFGTHALIQDKVEFDRLGLIIVDEQHRFGVLQRAALSGQGAHLLVMSATPIPRSLALTVFADLDLSILNEKPPGRSPVVTRVVREAALAKVYEHLRRRVAQGERAYLVFPLVEETEGNDLASASAAYEELGAGPLRGLRLGLLHGRMAAREKERIRKAFSTGELDVLVATTVVEVGVDVPEATLMVIHHAERFGLAQLHQLRGRVGRGERDSWCVLVASGEIGEAGSRRLKLLARCDDGFELAEADLRERGMGDLTGLRQHGLAPFRVLNPLSDGALVETARARAEAVLSTDPKLTLPLHRSLSRWLDHLGSRNPFWSATG
ncbi:MAG TPA: ATP-dependent DNA helicase RecG [Candidatus Krumholzibacteria bacterium]|nr:ATP-dependent DNA helicase RecG [Candidatus Krumholzibacteria bacterium]